MSMENLKFGGVDEMQIIFDLCDQNQDGLINTEDIRKIGIGRENLEKPQVDMLLKVMDPQNTGDISFLMFCRGIETFLMDSERIESSSSASDSSGITKVVCSDEYDSPHPGHEEESEGEEVYPLGHHNGGDGSYLSNGYINSNSGDGGGGGGVELIVDHCEELCSDNLINSSPSSNSPPIIKVTKESPTLVARNLKRRHHHQLTLSGSPSQASTPAGEGGEEEEVTRLSDQLHELSSKLEELEVDQKGNQGYQERLKKENSLLRSRIEECEDLLRSSELSNEQILSASQENLRTSINKVHRESERKLMEVQSQLQLTSEKLVKAKNIQASLKMQLELTHEEVSLKEEEVDDLKEGQRLVEEELRKTRDQLRLERERWAVERDSINQVVQDRDAHIDHLLHEHEKVHKDRRRNSITASDMEREIKRLKKQLEQSERRNDEFHSRFLQEGKELVAANSVPQSLEMEIEKVSKDEVMTALQNSEEANSRLKLYLDGLLTSIMEKHPELLEKI